MFQHFLVPTDGSELSHSAVAHAAALARTCGARMTLFHAEPDLPMAYAGLGALSSAHLTQELHQRLKSATRETLEAAHRVARDAGMECGHRVMAGARPYELIIQAAQECGCDLIFMASHGRQGVGALLLGSQTQKVLAHCTVAVLVHR